MAVCAAQPVMRWWPGATMPPANRIPRRGQPRFNIFPTVAAVTWLPAAATKNVSCVGPRRRDPFLEHAWRAKRAASASSGVNRCAHRNTVTWSTSVPRSTSRPSTSRYGKWNPAAAARPTGLGGADRRVDRVPAAPRAGQGADAVAVDQGGCWLACGSRVVRTDRLRDLAQVVVQLMIAPGQPVQPSLRDGAGVQISMRRWRGLVPQPMEHVHRRSVR